MTLWTSMISMDGLCCAASFVGHYVKTLWTCWNTYKDEDNTYLPSSIDETPYYSKAYAVENTLDRYVYYGVVQCLYTVGTSTFLFNPETVYYVMLAIHTPWIFNIVLYPWLKPFFIQLIIERQRCWYFLVYKHSKSLLEKVKNEKISFRLSDINVELLDLYTKHSLAIHGLLYLRDVHYWLYKCLKYGYFFDYQYKLEMMGVEVARKHIDDVVASKDWKQISDPRLVHALICVSYHEKYMQKNILQFEHQLILFFCLWSISEVSNAWGVLSLQLLFDFHNPWISIAKKSGWYALGAYFIFAHQWILFGCLVVLINTRFLDNFVIRTLYDFFYQRFFIKANISEDWVVLKSKD